MATICMVGLPGKVGKCVTNPPIHHPIPKPHGGLETEESGLYSGILVDVGILDGIHESIQSISDRGAREAIEQGVAAAVAAIQKRASGEVASITLGNEAARRAGQR